jgi:diaminohydroxyphosphoribosylaminopyrimidine deaminase/5-amino-6-(5-phosphoribosylamino)uracil reductase
MTPEDRRFLGLTFDLARQGTGRTSPNPLVGALVVKDGAIVGRGHHARAGEEHAETIALAEAGERARGAVLYVSLEPCCEHRLLHGRTSPCVDQILAAGIARVVAASRDPNPAIDGRGLCRLQDAGVVVEGPDPVFAVHAARLNEIFFTYVARRTPFVALKAGMTLDGKIALPSRRSRWITGEAARAEARLLRARYDAVLVGIETVLADDPELAPHSAGDGADGAGPVPRADRPVRVVLDSRLRLPAGSRLAASAARRPVLVYAAKGAPADRRKALEERGVVIVPAGEERVSIPHVLADLGSRELTSVFVEGGGAVLGSFLSGGHVDKLHLFVAPRILGGQDALSIIGGAAPDSLEAAVEVDITEIRAVGGDWCLTAYPRRRAETSS